MALRGVKVIELAGLAPGPFCGMVLADHGATVTRVDKVGPPSTDTLARGKRSVAVNLKKPAGVEIVKRLCESADVLIEPFRKGVMEKLGLGPSTLCHHNPRLIYARLTGFGQEGAYSDMAGHDINYLATSGVLSKLGRADSNPYAPINLLADFGGGGLMCALGIMMALFERVTSGKGQVIDANMVHGSAYLSTFLWCSQNIEYGGVLWGKGRGRNLLDGGAPFYDTYKTKDDKFMAVGALEPQFYDALLKGLDLDHSEYPQFSDWSKLRKRMTEIFLTKTQTEWTAVFDDTDSCVTPVVDANAANQHPHNKQTFVSNDKYFEPSPAPLLSRTPAKVATLLNPKVGEHTTRILEELGYTQSQIDKLVENKTIEQYKRSQL